MTALDMYTLFLGRIQKKSKRAIWPQDFNRVINVAYREWLEEKVEEIERDQKRIDDLSPLLYITDGTITVGTTKLDPISSSSGYFEIPSTYPKYFRLLSGSMVVTIGSTDYDGIYVTVLKSNIKASALFRDPYRLPMIDTNNLKRSRIYIQQMQDKIKYYLPDDADAKTLIIEYIKDPDDIFLDVNGDSSVACELDDRRAEQIIEIAVRKFMEEIQNPRYQTVLAETQIEKQFN